MRFTFYTSLRIALVHDWLLRLGGADRVLVALHKIFPAAPIYTLLYDEEFVRNYLPNATIIGSSLQKIPFIKKIYSLLPFLMPAAAEKLRLGKFDLIINSNFAFSKGVVLKPHTRQIVYCHSPTRWLWDLNSEYRDEFRKKGELKYAAVTAFQHIARLWDRISAQRTDYFIANSRHVARRIWKYYRKTATVIYPPLTQLATANYQPLTHKTVFSEYFLIVSRLFKNKNIDIAVKAFGRMPRFQLIIAGEGPERKNLQHIANKMHASNIHFVGFVPDDQLPMWYQNALAFLYPQEEDFGITALEAMSFGIPILALRYGGALESVVGGITGEFFADPQPVILADGVHRIYEKIKAGCYSPAVIKAHINRFSEEQFKERILKFIKSTASIY